MLTDEKNNFNINSSTTFNSLSQPSFEENNTLIKFLINLANTFMLRKIQLMIVVEIFNRLLHGLINDPVQLYNILKLPIDFGKTI